MLGEVVWEGRAGEAVDEGRAKRGDWGEEDLIVRGGVMIGRDALGQMYRVVILRNVRSSGFLDDTVASALSVEV